MELTLERDAFLSALSRARGAVKTGSTIPILSHVKLDASADGRLVVTGNSTEIEVAAVALADVNASGAITVPAVRLLDLVKGMPAGGQVKLRLDSAPVRLAVICGRSRYQLPTLPAAEFPTFARPDGAATRASISASLLAGMLDKVSPCISTEATRYNLGGIYLHHVVERGARRLRAVATDGSRLALAEAACPESWSAAPGVIVPREACAEIRRLVDGRKGEVEIWTDGSLVGATVGQAGDEVSLSSKTVSGTYPDYGRVIPRDNKLSLDIDVEELTAALRRASAVATDKARAVTLVSKGGELELEVRNSEGATGVEPVSADLSGGDCSAMFNAKYLGEFLAQMTGERIVIRLGGGGDPALITDPTAGGEDLFVLMPLRI